MAILDNFRQNLRSTMERKGVNHRELHRLSGVHWVTISRILSGNLEPSVTVCEQLATALKMTPEKIFEKSRQVHQKTA